MKIVRVLWGEPEYVINEIPKKPIFEDETVFVWGEKNCDLLKSYGYDVICISPYITEPEYSTHLLHFKHKLRALSIANERFEEYLFLDWDVTLAKPIDANFYDLIRRKGNIQCPLYAYHKEFKDDIKKYLIDKGVFETNQDDFLNNQIEQLYKYSWDFNDMRVLPCFCFFYSKNSNIASELLKIADERDIKTCIEEFSMWIYANISIDDYIKKYEPYVIRGKEFDKNLPAMTAAIKKINNYIDAKINKDIYLLHDTL